VHHFQERWLACRTLVSWGRILVGLANSDLSVGRVRASAALAGRLGIARRLLALQLALGTSAIGGLSALVLAIEFLANRGAFRIWGSASGVALRRRANSLAFGARVLFAFISGATNTADWALAMNNALGTRSLFASHFALGFGANRVANSWAGGIIALPFACRVALLSNSEANDQEESQGEQRFHLC